MKVVISIPDPVFEAAESLAEELGVSRSRLYFEAVSEYLVRRADERITESLDQVYSAAEAGSDPGLEALQLLSLPDEDW